MSPIARAGCFGVVALLAACAPTAPLTPACRLEQEADLPVRLVEGAILVPVKIDGAAVQLEVDTGATSSMIDERAVGALRLRSDPVRHTTVHATGGDLVVSNVLVGSLDVGGKQWQRLSLGAGRLARSFHESPPVAGLLGGDRLANFDVELDLPHRRMTLWAPSHCAGDFVPWDMPHFAVPLARAYPNRMILDVSVDGHPVKALVDWGARSTVMTGAAALRAGVTPQMLVYDPAGTSHGVDQARIAFRAHRFSEVRIGPEVFHQQAIQVADLHLQVVEMLLGADYARTRRIWLSYATGQMFVAPSQPASRQPAQPQTAQPPTAQLPTAQAQPARY